MKLHKLARASKSETTITSNPKTSCTEAPLVMMLWQAWLTNKKSNTPSNTIRAVQEDQEKSTAEKTWCKAHFFNVKRHRLQFEEQVRPQILHNAQNRNVNTLAIWELYITVTVCDSDAIDTALIRLQSSNMLNQCAEENSPAGLCRSVAALTGSLTPKTLKVKLVFKVKHHQLAVRWCSYEPASNQLNHRAASYTIYTHREPWNGRPMRYLDFFPSTKQVNKQIKDIIPTNCMTTTNDFIAYVIFNAKFQFLTQIVSSISK